MHSLHMSFVVQNSNCANFAPGGVLQTLELCICTLDVVAILCTEVATIGANIFAVLINVFRAGLKGLEGKWVVATSGRTAVSRSTNSAKPSRPGRQRTQWAFRPDLARSDWDDPCVPMVSEALLTAGADFGLLAHRCGKLVSTGFLGIQWDSDMRRATFIPLAFTFARGETEGAVLAILSTLRAAMDYMHGVDVATRVQHVFADGGPTCVAALRLVFPDARLAKCLQHTKNNVLQSELASCRNTAFAVQTWMHESACLPPAVFSFFWVAALDTLQANGEDEV